jgi:hypothetical protein
MLLTRLLLLYSGLVLLFLRSGLPYPAPYHNSPCSSSTAVSQTASLRMMCRLRGGKGHVRHDHEGDSLMGAPLSDMEEAEELELGNGEEM